MFAKKARQKSKVPALPGNLSQAAGEHLALGELLRHGHEVYLAQGSTQMGWDILMPRTDGVIKKIQVKAIDWPVSGRTAVNGDFTNERFDFLIIVLLNRESLNEPAVFLILTWGEATKEASAPIATRRGKRTINVPASFRTSRLVLAEAEAAWTKLKDAGCLPGPDTAT